MSVHARFRLDVVSRARGYYKAPGEQEAKQVESAWIELGAVQGEPFGSASPSGSFKMLIVNPGAAQMFLGAKIGQEFDVLISPVQAQE